MATWRDGTYTLALKLLFILTFALIGCGKQGAQNESLEDDDSTPGSYDSGLDAAKDGLDQLPTGGDPNKEEAVGEAKKNIDDWKQLYALLASMDPDNVDPYLNLLSITNQRAAQVAILLQQADPLFAQIASIFDQLAKSKPVFRIADARRPAKTRFYYTTEVRDFKTLKKRFGRGFRNDGAAFPVWTKSAPVDLQGFPQIPTKPLYACRMLGGGDYPSDAANCEGKRHRQVVLLGYTSTLGGAGAVPIHRLRNKKDGGRYLATIREDEKAKTVNLAFEKVLGEAAIPRLLRLQ